MLFGFHLIVVPELHLSGQLGPFIIMSGDSGLPLFPESEQLTLVTSPQDGFLFLLADVHLIQPPLLILHLEIFRTLPEVFSLDILSLFLELQHPLESSVEVGFNLVGRATAFEGTHKVDKS